MHPEFLSMALFWIVAAYTPGPNNVVASYSGFNFGIRKTIPHIFGVTIGFTSVVFALTIGLVNIFKLFPDLTFNIDAKSWDVAKPLAEVIRKSNALSRVHIASFSDRRVRYVSKLLNNEVKTVAGVSQVVKFVFGFLTGIGLKFSADFIQVPESKFGIKLVSSRSINYAHMVGILMHVWTINDEEKMRSLIELGVDGIMTDECRRLKAVLEKSI